MWPGFTHWGRILRPRYVRCLLFSIPPFVALSVPPLPPHLRSCPWKKSRYYTVACSRKLGPNFTPLNSGLGFFQIGWFAHQITNNPPQVHLSRVIILGSAHPIWMLHASEPPSNIHNKTQLPSICIERHWKFVLDGRFPVLMVYIGIRR